jgi:hypothetical protein
MDEGPEYPEARDGVVVPEITDGASVDVPAGPVAAPAVVHVPPAAVPSRRGIGLVLAAVAVVVIAAVGVVVGVTSGSPSATPPASAGSPSRVVLTAIDSTLGAKTADLHMTMVFTLPGKGQFRATGDGVMDFTNNASQVTVEYQGVASLDGFKLTELFVGGAGYLSMSHIGMIVPGKSWIALPSAGGSVAPGSSNPAAMFQILQAQGDQVTPLGPSEVNGAAVNGYHVVITEAAIRKRLSQANLPAGLAQAAQGMFSAGGITMDVYVDASSGMLRRTVVDLTMTIAGHTVTGKAIEDTSNFGTPVTITAPPADQVASFQEFTQGASSALNSASGG